MPGNVNDFLRFVHAEKSTTTASTSAATNHADEDVEIVDLSDEYFYDLENQPAAAPTVDAAQWPPTPQLPPPPPVRRNKRMFKNSNFIIDLPIGKRSLNWFLVTNDKIG